MSHTPLFGTFKLIVPGTGFTAPETWASTHWVEATKPENSTLYELENVTAFTLKNKGAEPRKRTVIIGNRRQEVPAGVSKLPPRGYSFETDEDNTLVQMLEHDAAAPAAGTGDYEGYNVITPHSLDNGQIAGYGYFAALGEDSDEDPVRIDVGFYCRVYLENDPEGKEDAPKYTIVALKDPTVAKGTLYQKS